VLLIVGLNHGLVKPLTIKVIFAATMPSTVLRSKMKDWLAWKQDNVSEWSNMSTHGLFFQQACTIDIQLSMLV
jgi:hypothetical protein